MTRANVLDPAWELDLIRAVLEWPDDQPTLDALQVVRPEWFLIGAHRALWEVLLGVAAEHGGVDAAATWTALRKDARFSPADRAALEGMIFSAGTGAIGSALAPLEALREAYLRRELTRRAGALGAAAGDFMVPLADLEALAAGVGDLSTADADRDDLRDTDMGAEIDRFLNGQALLDPHRARNLLVLGLPKIDEKMIAGPGALVVLAAKTSAGKSSLALQAAVRTQAAGIQSAVISLEMDGDEVASRIIATATATDSWEILRRTTGFNRQATEDLQAARKIRKVTKIPGRSFKAVAAKIRQMVRRWGVRCVVIDYFTLINPPDLGRGSSASTAFQLGEMSKALKALASDLGICIVLVSQLNRTVKDAERPTLESLRETGQLEQDANVVVFLWTDQAVTEPEASRRIHVELSKNRGGARWVRDMAWFDPKTSIFRPYEPEPMGEGLPESPRNRAAQQQAPFV